MKAGDQLLDHASRRSGRRGQFARQNASTFGSSDTPDGPRVERAQPRSGCAEPTAASQSHLQGAYTGTCDAVLADRARVRPHRQAAATLDNYATSTDRVDTWLDRRDARRPVVNWVRGTDNVTLGERRPDSLEDQVGVHRPPEHARVRPTIHGDVLHSRPVAVNYATRRPRIRWSSTTAATTASCAPINGNQTRNNNSPRRLARNCGLRCTRSITRSSSACARRTAHLMFPATVTPIRLPRSATTSSTGRSGCIRTQRDSERRCSSSRRCDAAAMRVYAFDVSDPTAPKFMWKITRRDGRLRYGARPDLVDGQGQIKRTTASATTDPGA